LRAATDHAGRLAAARGIAADVVETPGRRARTLDGASFLLDRPAAVPALWGPDQAVAWAEGESLLVVGPPGVGKSTLVQQLVLARLGLRPGVLGWPVVPESRRARAITPPITPITARARSRPRPSLEGTWAGAPRYLRPWDRSQPSYRRVPASNARAARPMRADTGNRGRAAPPVTTISPRATNPRNLKSMSFHLVTIIPRHEAGHQSKWPTVWKARVC
ncbi:MAG: hypothetical protein ACRDZ7_11195, partial [Acidimicrobiia bacterium]